MMFPYSPYIFPIFSLYFPYIFPIFPQYFPIKPLDPSGIFAELHRSEAAPGPAACSVMPSSSVPCRKMSIEWAVMGFDEDTQLYI